MIFSNSRTGQWDWDGSRRFCCAGIRGHPLEKPRDAHNNSGCCDLLGELSLGPAGEQKCNYCISNLTQDLARGMTGGFLVFPPAGIEIGSQLLPWPFCRLLKLKLLILSSGGKLLTQLSHPRDQARACTARGGNSSVSSPKFCGNTTIPPPGAGILQIFLSNTFYLQRAQAMPRIKQNNSVFTLIFDSLSLGIPDHSHFSRPSLLFIGILDYFGVLEDGFLFFFLQNLGPLGIIQVIYFQQREHFYLPAAFPITW